MHNDPPFALDQKMVDGILGHPSGPARCGHRRSRSLQFQHGRKTLKKYGGHFAFLGRAGLGFDSKDGFARSSCRAGSSPDNRCAASLARAPKPSSRDGRSLLRSWYHRNPALAHLNFSRLGLLCFRQHDGDHAVFHLGADLALVDLVRNLKAAGVVAHVVFRVDRLHALIL